MLSCTTTHIGCGSDALVYTCTLHCVSKNVAALAYYNFDVHQTDFDIFLAEMLLRKEAPHLTSVSALPGETKSRKLRLFT